MTESAPPAKDDAKKLKAAFSPAEGFDALVLLTRAFTDAVAGSRLLVTRSLDVDDYVMLVGLTEDPSSPVGKIAKRAIPTGPAARASRKLLIAQGLITEAQEGKSQSYKVTEEGAKVLAAVRAEASALITASDASLEALPRLASTVRGVVKVIQAPKAPTAERKAKKTAG